MRQLVGTPVQCGITELRIVVHQGNSFRHRFRLLFKERVDQFILWVGEGGVVKIHQHLFALLRGQERQLRHALAVISHHRRQQGV
ncbi:hypothetical protein Xkoz_00040 [Xenorhabdus kozodoii]|uniref:Uncharacterized protein n=1 Tax=Xenorhabdus kozodoii TaxID=351676 RepID=A0A2D0LH94_9GAMM|nr:hypothetical protein Xkoz_00040 [Xenorhabdus kozodoii]